MVIQLATEPTDQTIDLLPTDPHDQVQRIAREHRARTHSLTLLVEATMPDSRERAVLIAAMGDLNHEIANLLTVLDFLCWRAERRVA